MLGVHDGSAADVFVDDDDIAFMRAYLPYVITAFAIGALTVAVIIPLIIAFCRKYGYFDQPNQRKVHHVAVPRLGGFSFLPAMAMGGSITMLLYFSRNVESLPFHDTTALMILGTTAIYVVGLLDDLFDLPANLKFLIMAVIAALLPVCNLVLNNLYGFFGLYDLPWWLAYPLTVLVIMTIVNALNLIDGIDGLASGFSAIALLFLTYLFIDLRSIVFVIVSASLLGAVLMFFCFNFFGKVGGMKIFMGDAGSLILGYVLSYLAVKYMLISEQDIYTDINPILIPYSLFIVPVFDVVRVAITRLASGVPVFHADQRHIHHILMRCGMTMHQTLATILGLVVLFIVGNLILDDMQVPLTIIFFLDVAVYLLFFVVAYSVIHRREALMKLLAEE